MNDSSSVVEISDVELVNKVQQDDEDALNILFSRYEPFIKSCSFMLNYPWIDFEDLIQEGRIGLVSAVRNFRCNAGASFKTYACLCIKRKIASAVKVALSSKNIPINSSISLDEISDDFECREKSKNPEETLISKEQLLVVKTALSNLFSEDERKMFLMYLSGYSYKKIAEAVDYEVKQVDNSLQRIKRKLNILLS